MMRIYLLALFIAAMIAPAFSANWYLRPMTGGPYGANSGTSYANAWYRDQDIKWNLMADGDTLYVVGTRKRGYGDKALVVGHANITIRGDYSGEPGRIFSAAYYFTSGWTGPDAFGAYQRTYAQADAYHYFEDLTTRLIRETTVPDGTWAAGSVWLDDPNNTLYYKPTFGFANSHEFSVGDSDSSIDINAVSGVTVRNLTLLGAARGVWVRNGAANTTLNALAIKFQKGNSIQIGTGYTAGCPGGSITDCDISYCANGPYLVSDATSENSNGWTVRNNTLHDMDQDYFYHSTDAHGIGIQGGNNSIFEGNAIYNCGGSGITAWVNGPGHEWKNNIIRYNFIYDILNTSEVAHNERGIEFSPDNSYLADEVTGNEIYGNIIVDARKVGIRTKAKKPTTGFAVRISGNVIAGSISGIQLNLSNTGITLDGSIYNNIVFNCGTWNVEDTISGGIRPPAGSINNNVYFPNTGTRFKWSGTAYNFANWKTASSQDADSPTPADPGFVNASGLYNAATDFQITTDSPAYDAGKVLGFTRDYFDNIAPQGAAPDIGVHEVSVGEPEPTPTPTPTPTPFPVADPTITLTVPDSGQSWARGQNHAITWTTANVSASDPIWIRLYKGGSYHSTISYGTPNDGSFTWAIPSGFKTGSEYKIRIYLLKLTRIYDTGAAFGVTQ